MSGRDYFAAITSPATIAADIQQAAAIVADHKCAVGQKVEWRCDPLPGVGVQLFVSWPCEGDE